MSIETLTHLLIEYRYPALFLVSLIEGPFVAFFAGTLAAGGYFNLPILAAFFFVRDLAFDAGYYAVGFYGSRTRLVHNLLKKIGIHTGHLSEIRAVWEKHAFRTMFVGKISYGIAPAFIVTAGTIKMSLRTFFTWGALVAVVQYWGLLLVGYFFGNSFGGTLTGFIQNIQYVLGGGGLLLAGYYIFSWYMRTEFFKEERDLEKHFK